MNDTNALDETAAAFSRLYDIARTLRSEHGCPWDKDQTPLSLRRDLMEEAFEAIDAITQGDAAHVQEELGDVLFNAVLLARCYEQTGDFTLADSINMVSDKLIRRHPHVFAESAGAAEMNTPVRDSETVLNQWDRIKENVEGRKGDSVLDSVPEGFPPLLKAYKLIAKAEKKHFKWNCAAEALAKVQEEVAEMQEAAHAVEDCKNALKGSSQPQKSAQAENSAAKPFTVSGSTAELTEAQLHLEDEIGDVLFTFVNYARWLGVDCAVALERANRKFYRRFTHVEQQMQQHNIPMDGTHTDDEARFWNEAKQLEKQQNAR